MTGAELRASILQSAVQGKLVPQDPTDESASVLLERIREERHALVKAKKAKAPKGGESIITRYSDGTVWETRGKGKPIEITDEVPFDIPDGWEWARLDGYCLLLNGDRGKNYPAKNKLHDEGIPFISALNLSGGTVSSELLKYMDERQYEALHAGFVQLGDILFCVRGSLGKMGICPYDKGAIASSLVIVRQLFEGYRSYLSFALESPEMGRVIREKRNGTAQPNMSAADLGLFLVPIPPLAEQHRIVAKLEELMPLVERYDRLDRERTELNAGIEGAMRASVLQAAVQGQLTEREDGDEPASALLERIREERRALVKAKKAKVPKGGESRIWRASDGTVWEQRGKGKAVDITDEVPFDIPEGWEWCRLGSFALLEMGQSPKGEFVGNYSDGVEFHQGKKLFGDLWLHHSEETTVKPTKFAEPYSVLVSVRAPVGKVNVVDRRICIGRGLCAIKPMCGVAWEFIVAFIEMREHYLNEIATGTTFKAVSAQQLCDLFIPVPPLAEQRRIVAKLDEMLPKVERLGELAS